ncbi:MAG: nucleoside deaminase [Chitinispirillales bacterium]|jgi:tRNA(adenine34) deaminase|nr:nucleoside deaminase [Chitinispirillales bacterium]
MTPHEKFMKKALKEAQKAFANNEVPIGAVVVKDGKIIAKGYNKIELKQDPTAHAEIVALAAAAKKIGTWRLDDCQLFVSVEPCVMCLGACFQARVKKIVFGAGDSRFGAISNKNYVEIAKNVYMREPEIVGGVCEEKCKELLQTFFRQIRIKNKSLKN